MGGGKVEMKYWQRIEDRVNRHGLQSLIVKLVIDDGAKEHDLYVKTGWWHGRPVWVDVTVARHSGDMGDTLDVPMAVLPAVADLKRRLIDNTRSLMEIACRQASLLLSSRRCTLGEVADLWRVTEGEPKGRCPQLADEMGDRVHGPLDAVAKLFKAKAENWERQMAHNYTEDEIETMVEDCLRAVEERPDDFTGWERTFIESIEDQNQTVHLTDEQVEKLEQIWEERDCG